MFFGVGLCFHKSYWAKFKGRKDWDIKPISLSCMSKHESLKVWVSSSSSSSSAASRMTKERKTAKAKSSSRFPFHTKRAHKMCVYMVNYEGSEIKKKRETQTQQ